MLNDIEVDIIFMVSASEQVVIRSFPVSGLFKVKPINAHDLPQIMEINKNLQVKLTYVYCINNYA